MEISLHFNFELWIVSEFRDVATLCDNLNLPATFAVWSSLMTEICVFWDSLVRIMSRQGTSHLGFVFGRTGYSLLHSVETGSGAFPVSHPLDNGALSSHLKWRGHVARSVAEVKLKNMWSCTSTPANICLVWYFSTRENFTLYYRNN